MLSIHEHASSVRAWGAAMLLALLPAAASAQQVVSSVAELNSAVQAANSGSGPLTVLVADGTYALSQQLWLRADGITVRGQSGNRDAVILEGGGMTGNLTHAFQITGDDVTIADMTIRLVSNHCVQVHGENPYGADRPVLRNVRFQDSGQQMVKVSYNNGNPSSSDGGLVEGCLFEFTAGIGPQYYIGGVDAHQAQDWVVRGNTFRGIRSPDATVAEYAIHFWSGAGGTLVERNRIVNCDRGIGFGLGTRGHNGGIIRNNMIYHANLGADRGDVGIGMETAIGTEVYNNTIYQEHSYQAAISARFAASSVYVANNLIHIAGGGGNAVWARNSASITQEGNVLAAQGAWFADPTVGDLHLKTSVPSVVDQGVSVGGLSDDFDGDARPSGSAPDVGADEFTSTSGGSTLLPSSWGSVKAAWRG